MHGATAKNQYLQQRDVTTRSQCHWLRHLTPKFNLQMAPHFYVLHNYLADGTILEKDVFTTKCVWILSTTFSSNFSHSRMNLTRYKHTWFFMYNAWYICPILIKIEFSRHILMSPTRNFTEARPVAVEMFHVDGQRRDIVNSRFLPLCQPKKKTVFT